MTDLSIRFDIDLSENGDDFNEISYLDLLQKQLPSTANESSSNLAPNGNLNGSNHLEQLTKYFENKYGPLVTVKSKHHKKKVRVNDFVDPGEGYDCHDSFIDDSDADNAALAPDEMTKRGGFYINSESLQKVVVQQDILEPPAKRKKNETYTKFTPPKKNKSKQLLNKAVRCLSSSKKLKHTADEKLKMPHIEEIFDEVLSETSNTKYSTPLPKQNGLSSVADNSLLIDSKTLPMLKDQNDSLNNTQDQKEANTAAINDSTSKPPVLPDQLSNEIKDVVEKIKKFTEDLSQKDNKKFFCPEVDEYLIKLDTELNNPALSKPMRAGVYNYLEHFIPTKKSSLQRRIRKLKEDTETKKLMPMIEKLRISIKEAMPQLLERHEHDVKAYHARLNVWHEEVQKLNASKEMIVDITNEDGSPKFVPTSPKKPPKPNMPKRTFSFQKPEIRNVFNEIITCKMEAYYKLNVSKSSEEDYLKKFFHDTLMPLWPEGWMTIGQLWKNSHTAYERFKIHMSSQKNLTIKTSTPLSTNNTNKIKSSHSNSANSPKIAKTHQFNPSDAKPGKTTLVNTPTVEVVRGSANQEKSMPSMYMTPTLDSKLLEGLQMTQFKSKSKETPPSPITKSSCANDNSRDRSFDDVFKQVLNNDMLHKEPHLTVNTSLQCSDSSFLTPNKTQVKLEKQPAVPKSPVDIHKNKSQQSPNNINCPSNNFNPNPGKNIASNIPAPKTNNASKPNQNFNMRQSTSPTKFNQVSIPKPVSPNKPKSPNKQSKPANSTLMSPLNGNNMPSNQKQPCQSLPSMFEITNHFNHQSHKPRDYQFSPSTSSYINRPQSHPSYRSQQQIYSNISPNSNIAAPVSNNGPIPSPNCRSPIMQTVNKSFMTAMPAHSQPVVTGPPIQQNYSPVARTFDHSNHWAANQQVQSCSFPQSQRFPHSNQASPQVTDYSQPLMISNNLPYSNDHTPGLMVQQYMHMPQNVPANYANSNMPSDTTYSNFK